MAALLPNSTGAFAPAPPDPFPSSGSPLMSLRDWAAMASAPRRPPGTEVTVQASRISSDSGSGGLPWVGRHFGPDHMFVEFDDGTTPLIARGGPSISGADFPGSVIDGRNRVTARVDPAALSPDNGAGYRTLARTFIPGVTADQAAAAARRHAEGVNRGGNAYGADSNSNSYAADVAQPIFGRRPGDGKTWGSESHLRDDAPAAVPGGVFWGPLSGYDLTPIIRNPPY